LQPYSATSYVGLARLYEARKDVSNALRMMQRAVSIAPEQIAYQRTLARLLEQSGKRNHAQQVYQRLAAQQTTDPYVFYKLGEYAWQEGKLLQAIPYYRQAVQLQPEHAGYRHTLQRAVQQSQK
jgi:tetratricopeptide (TPR) repeat protein